MSLETTVYRENEHEFETSYSVNPGTQPLKNLEDEAHVYLAFSDKRRDPELLAWYRGLLSEEERKKHESFYFSRDRNLYLLTHGLLRTSLSRYLEGGPGDLVFTYTAQGRPELARSEGDSCLRFSVSRTRGLVACLVALSIDAGVDVEEIRKVQGLETGFGRVFSHAEISKLRELSGTSQVEFFFANWTLKEAYLKARGSGLSSPPNHFSFYCDSEKRIRLAVRSDLPDSLSNWQFASYRLTSSHALAVALHRKCRPDFRIRFFEATSETGSVFFVEKLLFNQKKITSRITEKVRRLKVNEKRDKWLCYKYIQV